jgi:hypothetical protein
MRFSVEFRGLHVSACSIRPPYAYLEVRFVSSGRDIAGNEDSDFSRDCRVPNTMNALLAVRPDAEIAHCFKPFDESGEVPLARRFWPLSQPGEPRAIVIVADDDKRFQPSDCLLRQAFDEVFVSALADERTRGQGDTLQLPW